MGVCEREGLGFAWVKMATDDRLTVRYRLGNRGNCDFVVECIECRLQVRMGLDTVFEFAFDFGDGADASEVGDVVDAVDGGEIRENGGVRELGSVGTVSAVIRFPTRRRRGRSRQRSRALGRLRLRTRRLLRQ